MKADLKFIKIEKDIPWDLFLLADPSKEKIKKYFNQGISFLALKNDKQIGAFILLKKTENIIQLMNISVNKEFQGRGYGKSILQYAIKHSKSLNYKVIEVGTGNSSLSQLAFYQKASFRITGIKTDFFKNNYKQEIIENGIPCLDMLILSKELV